MKHINLEDIVDELELISDDGASYLKRSTGKLIHLSSFEILNNNRNVTDTFLNLSKGETIGIDYLQLPTAKEINEPDMIFKFLQNFPDQRISEEIRKLEKDNKMNYWQMRNIVLRYNIGNEWYKYKREAFQKIAIDWCDRNSNSIPNSILNEFRMSKHK